MKSTTTLMLICLAAAFVTPAQAQMGKADTRFVADKCFFVMQFDMQKLFSYEKMGSKNLESLAKFFKKEASFNLMAMETLTVQFCEGEDASELDDDIFGFAMTFSEKVDSKGFLAGMEGIEFEEAEINGIKYFKATESYAPSICFTDDGKTVVMGMSGALTEMLQKKSADAKAAALLQSADPGAEVKGAFVGNETYRAFLREIASEIPVSPFNIEKVFGEAESAVISGNVKSSTPILLQVDCKSEDGAEDLAKKGKLLIDLGKATLPLGKESLEAEKKRLEGTDLKGFEKFQLRQAEMGLKRLAIAEQILEGASTSSQGKTATLKVKKMGGVKELIPMFAEMFNSQFMAIQELQEGIELPEVELGEDFEDAPKEAIK